MCQNDPWAYCAKQGWHGDHAVDGGKYHWTILSEMCNQAAPPPSDYMHLKGLGPRLSSLDGDGSIPTLQQMRGGESGRGLFQSQQPHHFHRQTHKISTQFKDYFDWFFFVAELSPNAPRPVSRWGGAVGMTTASPSNTKFQQ